MTLIQGVLVLTLNMKRILMNINVTLCLKGMVIVMDYEIIAKAVSSVTYEFYLRILPELIQYRFDCLMNDVDKWVCENFPGKHDESRKNK